MEGASATRLRFKTKSSSHKRKHSDRHHHEDQEDHPCHNQQRARSRSRSRSPLHFESRGDSSRSAKSARSPFRPRARRSSSSKYHVTPAGYAPDTYQDYLFDTEAQYERAAAFVLEQEEHERIKAAEQDRNPHGMECGRSQTEDDFWLYDLADNLEFHTGRFEGWTWSSSSTSSSNHQGRTNGRRRDHIINTMADEDYTHYMRQGMRRTRQEREAQEWEEWVQEQEQTRHREAKEEQKRKDERRRQRRQERKERVQLESEEHDPNRNENGSPANKLRKRVLVNSARRDYEHRWRILIEDTKSSVSMDMIPWPPLLDATLTEKSSLSSAGTNGISLSDFLFFGMDTEDREMRKQILRREQLRFHPDKFRQRFGTRLPGQSDAKRTLKTPEVDVIANADERDLILDRVNRVAKALNEIGEVL